MKLERETALGAQRSVYDDLSQRLRARRRAAPRPRAGLQPLRDSVGELQLEEQAAQLGGAQYLEQLRRPASIARRSAAASRKATSSCRACRARSTASTARSRRSARSTWRRSRSSATARERKTFLDAQNADLNEAMTTLEDAIHKIDLETRELLGNTFDQVNEHFGRMFPTLFGGGNARLVMTGDEILDAGVQVMAQPPGKKNSTIHLLSGGEKALTAIALVFAIFQLNPAPFCLLDEVDAPLDDANTERYAKLVNEMSQGTQFLFISHNKIAMEMAEQLIGVTMQEQGVSRIVTVDMPARGAAGRSGLSARAARPHGHPDGRAGIPGRRGPGRRHRARRLAGAPRRAEAASGTREEPSASAPTRGDEPALERRRRGGDRRCRRRRRRGGCRSGVPRSSMR